MKQETSKQLAKEIAEQRTTIRENARYIKEQEALIQTTLELGNNQILQLTFEADQLVIAIANRRAELLAVTRQVDDRRFKLLSLL